MVTAMEATCMPDALINRNKLAGPSPTCRPMPAPLGQETEGARGAKRDLSCIYATLKDRSVGNFPWHNDDCWSLLLVLVLSRVCPSPQVTFSCLSLSSPGA